MTTIDAATLPEVVELHPRLHDEEVAPHSGDVYRPRIDRHRAEAAARQLLEALAIDVTDESTRETPRRITPLRGLKFCRGGALAG